jgi:hypothetical protein
VARVLSRENVDIVLTGAGDNAECGFRIAE